MPMWFVTCNYIFLYSFILKGDRNNLIKSVVIAYKSRILNQDNQIAHMGLHIHSILLSNFLWLHVKVLDLTGPNPVTRSDINYKVYFILEYRL